jgi:glutamate/tyrosine decarboxylase-like PLP-dependent enzyme
MTSGGTESLLLAVKTHRDHARRKKPWIVRPNMVVPETIHVAFDKASHLFGVRKKVARVGADGAVDLAHMARLIDNQTIMLAASAPQYPHGTIDPIPEIGELALRHKLPLHVDACFGGFVLPFLERLGVAMPTWDFRVDGVTTLSADIHKYGFGAKGASVLLHRDASTLRHQFFVATDWSGGMYVSPGIPGTRPGGPIAAAWAAMRALGEEGYLELARGAWETAERLRAGIAAIPGLALMGRPHATIVTWTAVDPALDTYAIADLLQAEGWGVDRQQKPPSVHLSCNASNLPVVDKYLADLRAAVDAVRTRPELKSSGDAAVYGLMAKIPEVTGRLGGVFLKDAVLDAALPLYTGQGESPKSDLVDRYGPKIMQALERIDRVRKGVRRGVDKWLRRGAK